MAMTFCEYRSLARGSCDRPATHKQTRSPYRKLCVRHSRIMGIGPCDPIPSDVTLNVSEEIYGRLKTYAHDRMLTVREVIEYVIEKATRDTVGGCRSRAPDHSLEA